MFNDDLTDNLPLSQSETSLNQAPRGFGDRDGLENCDLIYPTQSSGFDVS